LRQAVLRHEGCLAQLPRAERRVLRLRAGVGIDHVRSRADVMRITGLSRKRVVAIERSAMKRLSTLARAGRCGSAPGSSTTSVDGTSAAAPRRPSASAHLRQSPRIAVRHERNASREPAPRSQPSSGDSRPLLGTPDDARDLAPIVLAVALAAVLFALVRQARKEHLSD
jgi:hypothetical protein